MSYRLTTKYVKKFVTQEIITRNTKRMGNTNTSSGKGHGKIYITSDLERLSNEMSKNLKHYFLC